MASLWQMPSLSDDERGRLLDGADGDLGAVEMALARLDGGTYFSCERCHADLADEWLSERPLTRLCPACATSAPA